jgi:cysteine-rich repeat protein
VTACRLAVCAVACASFLACQGDKDSYVVIHSDVNCDVPRVFQLRVTISNQGRSSQKTFPEVASLELGFPSSIVLALPSARSGAVDLVVEALDNKHTLVGQGTVSGTIAVSGRIDLQVQLAALTSATSSVCGNGSLEPNEECDDGNRISGDGCSFNCILETSVAVDGGVSGKDAGILTDQSSITVGTPFGQVAVGMHSTCALRTDSTLWCWGGNSYRQLLLSGTSNRLTPVQAPGAAWGQVACGQTHSCAVRIDGTLSCWGNNASGQLGATTASLDMAQTEVAGGPWQSVTTGSYQSCAIMTDGTLWCWGDNTNGQLGIAKSEPRNTPAQVAGQGWTQVSANYLHTCAVKTDGTLWCWGLNADLQVGDSLLTSYVSPTQVAGTDWAQVTTGLYHTCAVKRDATMWCWGGNYAGQLGTATIPVIATSKTSAPVQVIGADWKSVSAGQTHTCAVALDGALWCWGDNSHGQLGDKTQEMKSTPVDVVVVGQTWLAVAAAAAHTCALAAGGSLWCWGDNTAGQLGIGSNELRSSPARVVQQ